jgi:dihydroxy-acid dehydratase
VYEAGGKPGVFAVSDISDGVAQATDGMSYSLISRDIMAAMVEIHALGHPSERGPACDRPAPPLSVSSRAG